MADAVRVYFFAGKGGVGKTTLSSAFALKLADKGLKTLIVSTDPAHSLSDVLGSSVGNEETPITENLSALEIEPRKAVRDYIESVLKIMEGSVSPETFSHIKDMVRGVEDAPGTLETALIDVLSETILRNLGTHNAIVLDTAPTGHTLVA